MIKRALSIIIIAVFLLAGINGCNGSGDTGGDEEAVKTKADYEAEAQQEITTENMEQELDKIEKALAEEETEE
jgi:hypothetical protein